MHMDTYRNIKVSGNEKLVILVRNKMTGEVFEIPADTANIEQGKNASITIDGNEDNYSL